MTQHQRHLAATLTAPGSVLSHASAGDLWGLRPSTASFEVVTRPGAGGPRRFSDLLVCRSRTLDDDVVIHDGVPVTSPSRTIVDLAAHVATLERDRLATDALRLGLVTARALLDALDSHRGRRGLAGLEAHVQRLEPLPAARTRSHAELRALTLIAAARLPAPRVNLREAGAEIDLSWPSSCRTIEIDGPGFHRDATLDAIKVAAWDRAGWTVRRISSDAVFAEPSRVLALARWASAPGDERPSRRV